MAGSRLYAHRSVFDEVLENFVEASSFWQPRASLDPAGHMGPLVSDEQFTRVMGYIEQGKKAGASVALGGDSPVSEGGYYVNPTVLVDVKPEMSVVREEIFGPRRGRPALRRSRRSRAPGQRHPLRPRRGHLDQQSLAMHKLAAKLKAGTVWGNCHAMIDPALPFGGYKESGLGREQGRQGVEAYTELKSVIIAL